MHNTINETLQTLIELKSRLLEAFDTLRSRPEVIYKLDYDQLREISCSTDVRLARFKTSTNDNLMLLLTKHSLEKDETYLDGSFTVKPVNLIVHESMRFKDFMRLNKFEMTMDSEVLSHLYLSDSELIEFILDIKENNGRLTLNKDILSLKSLIKQLTNTIDLLDKFDTRFAKLNDNVIRSYLKSFKCTKKHSHFKQTDVERLSCFVSDKTLTRFDRHLTFNRFSHLYSIRVVKSLMNVDLSDYEFTVKLLELREELLKAHSTLHSRLDRCYKINYRSIQAIRYLNTSDFNYFRYAVEHELRNFLCTRGLTISRVYMTDEFELRPLMLMTDSNMSFDEFIEVNKIDTHYYNIQSVVDGLETSELLERLKNMTRDSIKYLSLESDFRHISNFIELCNQIIKGFDISDDEIDDIVKAVYDDIDYILSDKGKQKLDRLRADYDFTTFRGDDAERVIEGYVSELRDLSSFLKSSFSRLKWRLRYRHSVHYELITDDKELHAEWLESFKDDVTSRIDDILKKRELHKDKIFKSGTFELNPDKIKICKDMWLREFVDTNVVSEKSEFAFIKESCFMSTEELRQKLHRLRLDKIMTDRQVKEEIEWLSNFIDFINEIIQSHDDFRKDLNEINSNLVEDYKHSYLD